MEESLSDTRANARGRRRGREGMLRSAVLVHRLLACDGISVARTVFWQDHFSISARLGSQRSAVFIFFTLKPVVSFGILLMHEADRLASAPYCTNRFMPSNPGDLRFDSPTGTLSTRRSTPAARRTNGKRRWRCSARWSAKECLSPPSRSTLR